MKKFFLLLTLFTAGTLYAEVVMNDQGKCGYQDESGNLVINYSYDFIGDFNEYDVALVKQGKKWGMISKTGEVKVPLKYDEIGIFHQHAAHLVSGKKYGLVSDQGEIICAPQYVFIYNANSDGIRVAVKKRNNKAQKEFDHTHTYTLLGKDGKQLFAPQLGSSIGFYIPGDPVGVPKTFYNSEIVDTVDTRAGYISVYTTKGYTIYDLEGNVVLGDTDRDRILQEIFGPKAKAKNHPFYNHQLERAPINDIMVFLYNQKTKNNSVIDVAHGYYNIKTKKVLRYYTTQWTKKSGGLIAPCTPDENTALFAFSEGFAVANIDGAGNARTELLNEQGEVVKTFPFGGCMPYKHGYAAAMDNNKKWGLIDLHQNVVIPHRYEAISPNVNGSENNRFVCVAENKQWGTIDVNNKTIIPVAYDDIKSFDNSDIVLVYKQRQWGAFDGKQQSLQCQYDSLTNYTEGSVLCHHSNRMSVFSFPLKKMSEMVDGFRDVHEADAELHNNSCWELYKVENSTDTVYGYIDGLADVVVPFIFNNEASAYKAYKLYRNEPTQVFEGLTLYRLKLRFTTRERRYTLDAIVPDSDWDY